MADYSHMAEEELQQKLKAAVDYDERSAIRRALRELKKKKGLPVGGATRRVATYNRFAGKTGPVKAVTPKSFIAKEGREESGHRSITPSRTPIRSPVSSATLPSSPPPATSHSPSPKHRKRSPSPSPSPVTEATDGVPPHAEEEVEREEKEEEKEEEEEEEEEKEEEEREIEEAVDDREEEKEEEAEEEEEKEEEEEEEEKDEEEEEEEEEESGQQAEEEQKPQPVEDTPARSGKEETDKADDSPFGKRLRSRRPDTQPSTRKESEGEKAEFQGFELRRTTSQEPKERGQRGGAGGAVGGGGRAGGGWGHDLGVSLKQSEPKSATTDTVASKTPPTVTPRTRVKTASTPQENKTSSSLGGPKTLRDYQQLSASKQRSKAKSPADNGEEGRTIPVDELQGYLVRYANKELGLSPPIPPKGRALYDVCSNSANLCKLINKSVRNTVDLRALTHIYPSMSTGDREEAMQENMTLTIESARAIGCRVTDATGDQLLGKDPPTIRSFLIDLIRARVVHLPGMDDEPSSTFTNLSVLFSKLGIHVEEVEEADVAEEEEEEEEEEVVNGREGRGPTWREEDTERVRKALETPPTTPPPKGSWKESPQPPKSDRPPTNTELSYEERAALRRADREKKQTERLTSPADQIELSYEERAALRRAEREKRRRERAELAGSH